MTETRPEFKKVEQIIQSSNSDFYEHEEYAAAVSHWFHNPYICPPCMPEQVFSKITKFI